MFNVKRLDSRNNEEVKPFSWDHLQTQGLEKRDKRIVDENLGFKISFLVGRERFILIKLDYLRGMIFGNHLNLFLSNNASINERLSQFVNELKLAIMANRTDSKPFVLTVLEEFFRHAHNNFINQVDVLRPEFRRMNESTLDNKIENNFKERVFRIQKDHLQLHYKIKDIHELLHEFSSGKDEETIDELMIIKDETGNVKSQLFDLIDNYASYYEELAEELDQMDELINYMIKLVNIGVSETRNNLAKIGIYLHITSIGIASANLISSSFGMNLNNHLDYKHSFLVTNLIMLLILAIISVVGGYLFHQKYT